MCTPMIKRFWRCPWCPWINNLKLNVPLVSQEDVDPNDEAALAAFMAPAGGVAGQQQLSLGDLIVSKLREKQREAGVQVIPGWVRAGRCGPGG